MRRTKELVDGFVRRFAESEGGTILSIDRAFQIKAMDDAERVIEGVATTPTPDRYGDVVLSEGAKFTLPLPALWQHDSGQPVGQVTKAKVTEDSITATIELLKPDADMPPSLVESLNYAWQLTKRGLVRGLSIGFRPLDYVIVPDEYTFEFREWEWLELSLVTIPANTDATIQTVRNSHTVLPEAERVSSVQTPQTAVSMSDSARRVGRRHPVSLRG